MVLHHRWVTVDVVLPVSVGINGRVASGIVAPFVDFALREPWSLSVGDETCILDFHEVGIVGDEIEALCHFLERHVTAVCEAGCGFDTAACGDKDYSVCRTRAVNGRRGGVLENRDVFNILRIYVAYGYAGHAVDNHERSGIVERSDSAHPDSLCLIAGCVASAVCYGQT